MLKLLVRLFAVLFIAGVVGTKLMLAEMNSALAASHIPSPIDLSGLYSLILLVVELAGIISTITIIMKMPYWGTLYMLGWIIGFLFFWYSGLVNLTDTLLYTVPSVIVLAIKPYKKAGYDNYNIGYQLAEMKLA